MMNTTMAPNGEKRAESTNARLASTDFAACPKGATAPHEFTTTFAAPDTICRQPLAPARASAPDKAAAPRMMSPPPAPQVLAAVPARQSLLRQIFGRKAAEEQVAQAQADSACHRSALQSAVSAAIRYQDKNKALEHSRRLATHTKATFADRLQHLGLLEKYNSGEFSTCLAEIKQEAALEAAKAHALSEFLVSRHMAGVASSWLSELPETVRVDRSVLMARADCLVARRDWAGLTQSLAAEAWGDMDYLRHALLARAHRETKGMSKFESSWASAIHVAGEQPKALARLAKLAGDCGWQREQDAVLWNIVRRFPGETWAVESLRQNYTSRLDTFGLQLVYATIVGLHPDDLTAKNNLAATSLLLRSRLDRAHELAWEVYASDPKSASFATTYAWSLHLQGKSAEGMMVLSAFPLDQLEKPSVALYHGALLAAAGLKEMARIYLGIAARGFLLREERAILDQANARLVQTTRAAA